MANDWRRFVDNHRAAARVQSADPAAAWGPPARAITAALELIALYGHLHGWPPRDNPVDAREDLETWARFARLRARYSGR